eukprot:CAMPEP_0206493836 /NCGR_PEP_ID=MMETSP0324_2-20121206/47289_1 /ASSEMBLY_ACC=CAM_ASM_000836 /TAXON_ID=2866 /ORGANISM="Crypthecodinium cohnii, Strain Seligo" /LENGTH=534 /DNA_ID=CAMNT_0053977215 /DNA_START=24 /DNA_END=1624 /DNA_ORIENTATION=+
MNKLVVLAVAAANVGTAGAASFQSAANPIRKVVTLLQSMQEKVTAEGEKAKELYEKFECYCKTSGSDLAASVESAEAKLAELAPALEGTTSKKAKTEEELSASNKEREACKTAVAEATALREKEKAAFDALLGDSKANLAALNKAIAALERGMSGGFLQTQAASTLRHLVTNKKDLDENDRQTILSFLSNDSQYAPASGEIVGILTTIKDEMFASQKDAIATEEAAVKTFEELTAAKKKEVAALSEGIETKLARISELGLELTAAKKKEVAALSEGIETKLARISELGLELTAAKKKEVAALSEGIETKLARISELGLELTAAKKKEVAALSEGIETKLARISELGLEIANMKNDVGDTSDSLEDDKAFLADMEKNCAEKAATFEQEKKLRAEELLALAETIKVLNDDEALDLFKTTLPAASVSLVQVQSTTTAQRNKALAFLGAAAAKLSAREGRHNVDIVMLALSDKKVGFEKVIKLVDELVATLKQEQADEESKQAYCNTEFDLADDHKKASKQELSEEDQIFVNNGGTPP